MKKSKVTKFIRPYILKMAPYVPASSVWDLAEKWNSSVDTIIKLDAGENMFGYSPNLSKALKNFKLFNYYPDPEYKKLRKALAKYAGVEMENIVVGSGSDELLDLVFRLILNEGEKIISCPPTFGMYPFLIELNRGILVSIPRNEDFSLDIKTIKEKIDKKVKAIIICTPNNPTGTVSSEEEIISLIKTKKLVIVDEAYFEFYGKTVVPLLSKYENLIILRTLSKWAGLAGLRLGYAIMSPSLVEQTLKIKQPYNVNLIAEIACKVTLKNVGYSKKIIDKIIKERERVFMELCKIPYLTVYPSKANLLFIRVKDKLNELRKYLENKKIALRYYGSNGLRISIGRPEQNNQAISALKEFQNSKVKSDSIIFDMDGVLVDVSKSYRQAIKKTVAYVLRNAFNIRSKVSSEDIEGIKKIPWFNNDWDLSFTLAKLLSQGVKKNQFGKKAKPVTNQVRNTRNYQGVKDVFQTFYLGSKMFRNIYNRKPPFNYYAPLIQNETLVIKKQILDILSRKYKLGVATSRPRFEALFALRNLGLSPQYIKEDYVVAQEDVTKEKPAPDPLLQAKKRLDAKNPIYVGDTINDVLAAGKAKILCIFVGKSALGDIRIDSINQIKEVINL